jgi:hypothetical protein
MNLARVEQSLSDTEPPPGLPPLVTAMWYERRGEWDRAHEIAQDLPGADAAWVHAYLHRREGDVANAGYWYRQAARPVPRGPLDDEWRAIVDALIRSS